MKRLLKKVETKKSKFDEVRAVQWDGSNRILGKYTVFQIPTILAKKLGYDGILQLNNDNYVGLLKKGDYLVISMWKDRTYMYALSPKKFNKQFKFVD